MAAKAQSQLSFIDIVTRADADIIRQALEARVKIDDLLVIREEAYKKIFDIENEIEGICGEEGTFEFGEAPYPVAGQTKKKPAKKKPRPAPQVIEESEVEAKSDETSKGAEEEHVEEAEPVVTTDAKATDADELSYKNIDEESEE